MHAVFITFTSAASLEDLRAPNLEVAQALAGGRIAGFVAKTWLANGNTLGRWETQP